MQGLPVSGPDSVTQTEVVVTVTPSVVVVPVAAGEGVVGVWAKIKKRNQYILIQS